LRAPVQIIAVVFFLLILVAGTIHNPHFWLTADQRGDRLLAKKLFSEAAQAYSDPQHVGVAQYRNGDFEAAARTFARVPGPDGAFDQGNAWLMHGNYDAAIESYDRALRFRHPWKQAEENKALARARKELIEASGKDRDEEATEAYTPDELVFDQKGADKNDKPVEMNDATMSDEALRATWLRRVQTTPGDFLRAKFAYQATTKLKGTKEESK
jgi:Ca-activated chloride channel family protein